MHKFLRDDRLRRYRARWFQAWILVLCCTSLDACKDSESSTAIDLTVHADPTLAIDAVDIAIRAAGKADKHLSRPPGEQILVNIFIDGLASGAIVNIEVAGVSNGITVVLAHAKAAVIVGKHVPVAVNLTSACLGVLTCTGEETCEHGLCVPLPSPADGGTPDTTSDAAAGGGGHGGSGTNNGGSPNIGGRGGLVGSGGAIAGSGGAGTGSGGGNSGVGTGGTIGPGGAGGVAASSGGTIGPGGAGGAEAGSGGGMTLGTGGAAGGSKGSGGSGTGGMTPGCQAGATQCSSGGLQTCSINGQWGAGKPCGTRQTCSGPSGTAKCTCNADPVCTSIGPTCTSTSKLASCGQDGDGCFYQTSSLMCTNGACIGMSGAGTCCTNACTSGALQCGNGGIQTCQAVPNGCTTWKATSACGEPLVCERYTGPTCSDPNWAAWPVPNGQLDAQGGAPNPAVYVNNGDGTVTDKVTGLIWQQTTTADMTPSEAASYCSNLALGGQDDWRLPTLIELASLLDFGVNPSIDAISFPNTPAVAFWSSSLGANSPGTGWQVFFAGGFSEAAPLTTKGYVRCVR